MRVLAAVLLLSASLGLSACGDSGDPAINEVLDNLQDVVEQIEGFEGKSSVCMTEVTAVMAKFMELGQQSSELTKQGKKPSEAQIERQMKLAARAQKMQSALATTQPDMSC